LHHKQPTPFGSVCETIATESAEREIGLTINRFSSDSPLLLLWLGVGKVGSEPKDILSFPLDPAQVLEILKHLNAWAAELNPGVNDAKH
jgi:hypothetical protein